MTASRSACFPASARGRFSRPGHAFLPAIEQGMARDNAVRDMRARDEPILIEVDVERVGVDR